MLPASEKVVEKKFSEYVAFKLRYIFLIRGAREYIISRRENSICTAPQQGKNADCSHYWEKPGLVGEESTGKEGDRDKILQYVPWVPNAMGNEPLVNYNIACSCCYETRSGGLCL